MDEQKIKSDRFLILLYKMILQMEDSEPLELQDLKKSLSVSAWEGYGEFFNKGDLPPRVWLDDCISKAKEWSDDPCTVCSQLWYEPEKPLFPVSTPPDVKEKLLVKSLDLLSSEIGLSAEQKAKFDPLMKEIFSIIEKAYGGDRTLHDEEREENIMAEGGASIEPAVDKEKECA